MKKVFILCILLPLTGCWTVATGEKIGIVTKLAKQGVILKTWEGQLIRGGLNNGSGSFGAPFDFTVEDPATLSALKTAMEKSQEIKVNYHKEGFTFFRSESDDYFVDSIEVVSK